MPETEDYVKALDLFKNITDNYGCGQLQYCQGSRKWIARFTRGNTWAHSLRGEGDTAYTAVNDAYLKAIGDKM